MTHTRNPVPVLAWQFNGEPRPEWPQWVQDYQVYGGMGAQPVSRDAATGSLIVPTKGSSIVCAKSDWLVADGFEANDKGVYDMARAAVGVAHDGDFKSDYTPIAEDA